MIFDGLVGKMRHVPGAAHRLRLHRRGSSCALIGLYTVSALFSYLQQYIMAGVAQKTVYDMRKDVSDKLARLPLKFFDGRTHGEILSRFTNDMDNIASTLQQSLDAAHHLGGDHPRRHRHDAHDQSPADADHPRRSPAQLRHDADHRATVPEVLRRAVEAHRRAQRPRGGDVHGPRHREGIRPREEVHREVQRRQRQGLRGQLAGAVRLGPHVPDDEVHQQHRLRGGGGGRRHHGHAQAPSPSATSRRSSSTRGSSPCPSRRRPTSPTSCRAPWPPRSACSSCSTRRRKSPTAAEAAVLSSPRGEVRFENVRFSYKADVPLIEDMNLDVKQGQTIAIVGPTGAGKTTLVNLLMRFYEIAGGADHRGRRGHPRRAAAGTSGAPSAWCCRTRGCSTGPSVTTSPTGRDGVDGRGGAPGGDGRPRGPLHPDPARTATTRCSTRTRPTSRRGRSSS